VAAPRSTVLWALTAGQWSAAGLLLESPEPLIRPGRMAIHAATLGGAALTVVRSFRTGSRALWLRREPITLAAAAALVVTADNLTAAFQRRARVEPRPRFLHGPIKGAEA